MSSDGANPTPHFFLYPSLPYRSLALGPRPNKLIRKAPREYYFVRYINWLEISKQINPCLKQNNDQYLHIISQIVKIMAVFSFQSRTQSINLSGTAEKKTHYFISATTFAPVDADNLITRGFLDARITHSEQNKTLFAYTHCAFIPLSED